ncbi:MAG: hypothetical protein H6868_02520 [Rhodospirillales bacterium]|nr:hypothetical protein [Rhodospirillales bacterium]
MGQFIYQWVDFLWLPAAWFVVHKHQRWFVLGFIFVCLLTFRTQVELMESIGYGTGILALMKSSVYNRGLIIYSIIFALYMILAYFSPGTQKVIFFAASLSIYILAFCFSMIMMTL